MNLLTRRLPISEIVKTTGFIKKEEALLEQAAKLARQLEREGDGRKYVVIGGFATRVYVSAEHKGRIGNGSPTDIDVAFLELPPGLKQRLNEERLIESVDTRLTTMFEHPIGRVRESPYSVFHLKSELVAEHPMLDHVCFFERRVGQIVIRPIDILSARTIEMYVQGHGDLTTQALSEEVSVRIADPGFVLATIINPDAITDTRTWRAILILASLSREEFPNAIERYVDVIKTSGIENWETALTKIDQIAKKKGFRSVIEEFVDLARDKFATLVKPE